MIRVFAFFTPNSIRIPVALEELGMEYLLTAVNVRKGAQKAPPSLAINPNGKVPVIIDPDGPGGVPLTLTESNATWSTLQTRQTRFSPKMPDCAPASSTNSFFHGTGIGPAFGQAGYFKKEAPEQIPRSAPPASRPAASRRTASGAHVFIET